MLHYLHLLFLFAGIPLNPKPSKVLAPKGSKNVYNVVGHNEKENVTVLVTETLQVIWHQYLFYLKESLYPIMLLKWLHKIIVLGTQNMDGWQQKITMST